MSEEENDRACAKCWLHIEQLEAEYEKISSEDPIARGHIGRKILELVYKANLATAYLFHCQHQAEGELQVPARARIELMIGILTSDTSSY